MATLTRPDDIVVEFLRARLTDVRSRYTSESDSFPSVDIGDKTVTISDKLVLSDYYSSWDYGTASYTLTPTTASNVVRAIRSVKRGTTTLKKWQDYTINLDSKQVALTATPAGNKNTVIEYYNSGAGGEWIYPGFPIAKMGKAKFPRISVQIISKTGDRAGPYTAPIAHDIYFQVDCWAKDGYYKEVDGNRYEGQDLADYLALRVESAFIDYIDDLYPKLYNYTEVAFGQMPFDDVSQTYRHKQDFTLTGLNAGH